MTLELTNLGILITINQSLNKYTINVCNIKIHLRGSMSSAIIFNAASANFFWSTGTATGAAPELELGLELKLEGNGGLGDENSLLGAVVCGA